MQPSRSAACSLLPFLAIPYGISCRPLWVRPLLEQHVGLRLRKGSSEVKSRVTQSDAHPDGPGYTGPERRSRTSAVEVAPVRLTHKYAEVIDGIDLSRSEVGERLPLTSRDARMLIAERWAEPVAAEEQRNPEK